jgi:tetratricopeptide (TPR) repeat protein
VIVARPAVWINLRFGLRPLVWGGVLALAALALDFVPLFDLLGFDFSFALGLVATFAAADVGHGAVAAARRAQRPVSLLSLVLSAIAAGLALLAAPLLLSLANALRVRNCNLPVGLAFYALLPVASVLVAAPAGVLAGLLVRGPRLGRVVALTVPAVSIGWALLRLYVDPPVAALDPFGGYFPGPIYDEGLRPSARLVWFRLANLTWIATAVALTGCLSHGGQPAEAGPPALAWRRFSSRLTLARWLAATVVLLVGSALWFGFRAELGFRETKHDLVRVLSRRTQSEHFVMWSEPAGDAPAEIALVHSDLEFRYHQLRAILGSEPRTPITVYRFSSAQAKKDLVGAGGTLYAKPWMREIYVQAEHFPASRLRHELAHVFAGAFGDSLFGVSLAWRWWGPLPVPHLGTGLIEGVAEAADFGDPDGRATLHQQARAMIALGQAPSLARVMGAGFSAESGARAYVLAGSFCRFLLDRFGADKLRAAYRSAGDFEAVYGSPLAELEKSWRAFLETQPLDARDEARAKERFRKPAIFRKVCARELAERVAEARERMGSMPDAAVSLLESVCRDDPDEPAYRLDRAGALAAAGASDQALALARPMLDDETLTWPVRAQAANLIGVVEFHRGHFAETAAAVERSLALATDENEMRMAWAKRRALADAGARGTLGRALFGDGPGRVPDPGLVVFLADEFARLHPDEALGPYLVGRQLAGRDPHLALAPLAQACPLDGPALAVPLEPAFLKECRRLYGESAFLAGDLSLTRRIYEALRDQATLQADRLRASDFLERIAWQSSR